MHRHFFVRATEFQTPDGRASTIHELDDIGQRFYDLWGYLDELLVRRFADHERSTDYLRRLMRDTTVRSGS